MKLKNIKRPDQREVVVKFDDPLTITYDRNKITAEFEDKMMELYDARRGMGAVARMLSEVITDWDLSDDSISYDDARKDDPSLPETPTTKDWIYDKESSKYYLKVPITEEFIRSLGPEPIEKIADAIGDDTSPNQKKSSPTRTF